MMKKFISSVKSNFKFLIDEYNFVLEGVESIPSYKYFTRVKYKEENLRIEVAYDERDPFLWVRLCGKKGKYVDVNMFLASENKINQHPDSSEELEKSLTEYSRILRKNYNEYKSRV